MSSKNKEKIIIPICSRKEEDLVFFLEVFGEDALKQGWAREENRLYVVDDSLSPEKILQIFNNPAPKSILDMPLPGKPAGELCRHLFTMPDGTEVTWIRHPSVLPEGSQKHWRDHMLHFQFLNKKLGYEAHHSVHRLAVVEANDGLPHLFAPGGVRWVDYPTRESMISDSLDMSLAVSMKIEVVHTPSAGSKIAIRADKKNTGPVLSSLYAAVERMGMAITAADLGVTTEELDNYAVPVAPTSCVPVGVYRDGLPSSLVTAEGVAEGLYAMVDTLPGHPAPSDVTVSIQGIGEVGYTLASRLLAKGVKIVIAEINPDAIARFRNEFAAACADGRARILDVPSDIYDVRADIFCPCALRDILNEETLPRFKAAGIKMIGGPANNVFSNQLTGPWLFQDAGISVIPYEGIGAGGVTGVAQAIMTGFFGRCPFDYAEKVKVIGAYVAKILHYARAYNLPAQVISDRILLNNVKRRTLFDHAKSEAFMEKMADSFEAGEAFENVVVRRWTKNGFFYGAGKFPRGGWRYL